MEPWNLKEIAKILQLSCESDAEILDVCTDTRAITPGCLFIALKGERFDGNDFVAQALETGAAAVVCSRKDTSAIGVQLLVEDTLAAYQKLARAYCEKFPIPKVALTGSVGKTTTKEMTAVVLEEKFRTLKTEGNWNNQIGVPRMAFRLEKSHTAAVFEMGMDHRHQIENLSRIVQPSIAILTNIGLSHIENLGSQEEILRSKLEILEGMEPGAPLVLNGDDPFLAKAAAETNHPVILYGLKNPTCHAFADNIRQEGEETTFTMHLGETAFPVRLPTIGEHNVLNALAAATVGEWLGETPDQITAGLLRYVPSGMRQKVVRLEGLTVIEDCYNASPDAVKASLRTLRDFPGSGRKIAVLGDMKELGDYAEASHRLCGQYAAEMGVEMLFTYGENSRFTAEEGQKNGLTVKNTSDAEELANDLVKYLQEGDTVLFKASRGMKLEEVIHLLYEKRENR